MPYLKDPNEKKDYAVDWTRHLTENDTISSSTWSHAPAGLTLSNQTATATIASVWIAGGTIGVEYRVTNHVVTSQGRELERSFVVVVTDL